MTKTKTDAGELAGVTATANDVVRMAALAEIKPAPWNPRQTRDAKKDAELLASVKETGVNQSLLVRPVNSHLELACGTRRFEAAQKAGLASVPVLIREMTDAQVLEAQTIENSQREDVHPLEEAECYRRMQVEHHISPEEIAVKVGKSRTWVYSRIKLLALVDSARKAFLDGKLDVSTALLVARIPDSELQKKACTELTRQSYDGSLMSYRQAAEFVQSHFMLKLADAGFKTTDADLVAAAGPCTTCPKRTGTQKELFADVKSADVCTDPKCYREKQDAAWAARAAAAEAAGQRVLTEAESAKVFGKYSPEQVERGAGYVDLDGEEWVGDKNKKWRAILGKAAPEPILARDPHGNIHELVPKEVAAAAVKQTHAKVDSYALGQRSRGLSASEKKQRDEQKRKRAVTAFVLGQVVVAAAKAAVDDAFWRFIGQGFLEGSYHDILTEVCKRRGLTIGKTGGYGADPSGAIGKELNILKGGELRALIVEIVATHGAYSTWGNADGRLITKACDLLDLNRKTLEADARKQFAAAKEKPAKAPKKSAAKPAKKSRKR